MNLPLLLFALAQAPAPQPQTSKDNWFDPPPQSPMLRVRDSSTVTVITGESLRQSGVRFLSDALRLYPGFEISRMSSTESNVSLRTFHDNTGAGQGVLGLLDGRPVTNEFYGNVFWDQLPVSLDSIEQVEVVRGPGSFLHGPNAMHGVVNIVTRSPLDYPAGTTVRLSGQYGSYHSSAGSLLFVKKDDDQGFKASLGWDDIDEFEPSGQNTRDKVFFEGRYGRRFGAHIVEATAGISKQKLDTLIQPFAGLPSAEYQSEALDAFVKIDWHYPSSRMPGNPYPKFKATASWNRFDTDSVPNRVYLPFRLDLDTFDVDLQGEFKVLGSHVVSAGAGYRRAQFRTTDEDVADGRHATNLGWVFAQDEFPLFQDVVVTGGVRWDQHSETGDAVSPRLAVVWTLDREEEKGHDEAREPTHTLRFAAAYGYREPSLRELWFDMPISVSGITPVVTGDEDLQTEKLRSFELAYRARPHPKLRVGAAVYYNLVDRLIGYGTTAFLPSPPFPPGLPAELGPENSGKQLAYGGELEARYRLTDDLSAFASYAYGIRLDRDTRDRIPFAPRHKAIAGLRLTVDPLFSGNPSGGDAGTDGLAVMLWATYFDDVEFPSGAVDAYVLVNARVSYERRVGEMKLRGFVEAFNALDDDHRENPDGDEYGMMLSGGLELDW